MGQGTHSNLGILLKKKGDLAGAEAAYRRVIEIDPEHAEAHSNLGSLLKMKADTLEAAGGGGKELAALLTEAADHRLACKGKDDAKVAAWRAKAAGLV